ncbi:MAG: winged helix-turn-helix transcriptional regulator [Ruminococcus sp.]|nr:winged helix-turn-helix transcriptional regulator [Ruminococcus sp.]
MVDRFERFSFAIFEVSRYWHKLAADEMAKYSLKGPHATYLTTLYRYEEGITAPLLSELCGKDKADVSRMMSIMEKKGLVVKESVGKNLYRGLLKLTDEGKRAAEHVKERIDLAVELAGKGLSEEDRANFYDSLELIATNLKKLSEEGIPS